MKITSTLTTVVLTSWMVSCSPAPEEAPPIPPTDVAANRAAGTEVTSDGPNVMADDASSQAGEVNGNAETGEQRITETIVDPLPSKPEPKAAVPVARRVPGRDGFVFSPYNNKMINVKDFASGTMVADPTYPPAEKKYFRVP